MTDTSRFPSVPEVECKEVCSDGKVVGLAVRLGSGVVFYSTEPDLLELDGRRYPSLHLLHRSVQEAHKGARATEKAVA